MPVWLDREKHAHLLDELLETLKLAARQDDGAVLLLRESQTGPADSPQYHLNGWCFKTGNIIAIPAADIEREWKGLFGVEEGDIVGEEQKIE